MVVVACKLDLHLPEVHSLKEKRQILTKLISRTRNQFNLAIAEVGAQELWQRAELGIGFVGHDMTLLYKLIDQVLHFIDGLHIVEVLSHQTESLKL